ASSIAATSGKPDGKYLYVASAFNSTILQYNAADGSFIKVFVGPNKKTNGDLEDPEGLAYRNGLLYVTSSNTGAVLQYDGTTGAFIKPYTPEPLKTPEAAVINPADNNLYVASRDLNEV